MYGLSQDILYSYSLNQPYFHIVRERIQMAFGWGDGNNQYQVAFHNTHFQQYDFFSV